MNIERELPRYRSHKEVWALKIRSIVPITAEELTGSDGPKPDGAMIYPEDSGYGPVTVDQSYMTKHEPKVGGYYVVYADGYRSFSPSDAFEEGYTLV